MVKGRAPCCDKNEVKKGPWSSVEDLMLTSFIQKHGHQNWRALPKQAGRYILNFFPSSSFPFLPLISQNSPGKIKKWCFYAHAGSGNFFCFHTIHIIKITFFF